MKIKKRQNNFEKIPGSKILPGGCSCSTSCTCCCCLHGIGAGGVGFVRGWESGDTVSKKFLFAFLWFVFLAILGLAFDLGWMILLFGSSAIYFSHELALLLYGASAIAFSFMLHKFLIGDRKQNQNFNLNQRRVVQRNNLQSQVEKVMEEFQKKESFDANINQDKNYSENLNNKHEQKF